MLLGLLSLSACDIVNGLSDIDLPNILFENSCGTYHFAKDSAPERCGTNWDSFGFIYQQDQIVKVVLSPDADSALDYTPAYQIWFDSRYLKVGQTVGPAQALATCSRFRPEDPTGDPTYYTEYSHDFSLKVVEDQGVKHDDILDDQSRWVLQWDMHCPGLGMDAKGQDKIDLDLNPVPSRWKNAGEKDPPKYVEPNASPSPTTGTQK